jgi:hypothetical protein
VLLTGRSIEHEADFLAQYFTNHRAKIELARQCPVQVRVPVAVEAMFWIQMKSFFCWISFWQNVRDFGSFAFASGRKFHP